MEEANKNTFVDHKYDQVILNSAFSLGCFTKDNFLASGTAVIIAPNLACTARHVVEDFFEKFLNINKDDMYRGRGDLHNKLANSDVRLVALQYQNDGNEVNIWRVQQIFFCLLTDIVFLYLLPSNDSADSYKKWFPCKINLFPPKIGENIYGFGFRSSNLSLISNTEKEMTLKWDDQPSTTTGQVIDYHPQQRDSSRLTFPCFQTNARFDGGMSGGPVFNELGQLCGLICSSLPAMNDDEEHVSYVALIWPSLIAQITIPYKQLIGHVPYPLLDLARIGIITAIGFERVTLINTEGGDWYDRIEFNEA